MLLERERVLSPFLTSEAVGMKNGLKSGLRVHAQALFVCLTLHRGALSI